MINTRLIPVFFLRNQKRKACRPRITAAWWQQEVFATKRCASSSVWDHPTKIKYESIRRQYNVHSLLQSIARTELCRMPPPTFLLNSRTGRNCILHPAKSPQIKSVFWDVLGLPTRTQRKYFRSTSFWDERHEPQELWVAEGFCHAKLRVRSRAVNL